MMCHGVKLIRLVVLMKSQVNGIKCSYPTFSSKTGQLSTRSITIP